MKLIKIYPSYFALYILIILIIISFYNNIYMNTNLNKNNEDDETKSIIISLEMLKLQYKNLLLEYKQALTNYINYLMTESNDITSNNSIQLTSIQNASFLGESGISKIDSSSIEDCQAQCSFTVGCSGATFNSKNSSCLIRKGNGELLSGNSEEYAIIPEGKKLLMIVNKLNDQLIDTNKQIEKKMKISEPLYKKQSIERKENTKELVTNFIDLIDEKKKITELLNEYEKLDQIKEESNIDVTQKYYYFIILLTLTICIIILLYKFSLSFENPNNNVYIQTGGNFRFSTYFMLFFLFIIIILLKIMSYK